MIQLIALSAGPGVYRVPAFTVEGVRVPMTTIMMLKKGWTPFIDGENLRDDMTTLSGKASMTTCIHDYMTRQGLDIVVSVKFKK